jgi:hypothetical protein
MPVWVKMKVIKSMGSLGVAILGGILLLIGFVSSFWNSYLIMVTIAASGFMWLLWYTAIGCTIIGSILCALAKD